MGKIQIHTDIVISPVPPNPPPRPGSDCGAPPPKPPPPPNPPPFPPALGYPPPAPPFGGFCAGAAYEEPPLRRAAMDVDAEKVGSYYYLRFL